TWIAGFRSADKRENQSWHREKFAARRICAWAVVELGRTAGRNRGGGFRIGRRDTGQPQVLAARRWFDERGDRCGCAEGAAQEPAARRATRSGRLLTPCRLQHYRRQVRHHADRFAPRKHGGAFRRYRAAQASKRAT